jgi:hypothetical protein
MTTLSTGSEPQPRRWAVVAARLARHKTLITGGVYAATIVLTLVIVALLGELRCRWRAASVF